MKQKSAFLWMFILSIAGVLFAGYLTFTKFVLGTCPLKEPCPMFFGQPACIYGLVLFLALLILSGVMLFRKNNISKSLYNSTLVVSIIGIIFAAVSIYKDVSVTCPGGCVYSLLLPTCIYGFAMFLGIFVFLLISKNGRA